MRIVKKPDGLNAAYRQAGYKTLLDATGTAAGSVRVDFVDGYRLAAHEIRGGAPVFELRLGREELVTIVYAATGDAKFARELDRKLRA